MSDRQKLRTIAEGLYNTNNLRNLLTAKQIMNYLDESSRTMKDTSDKKRRLRGSIYSAFMRNIDKASSNQAIYLDGNINELCYDLEQRSNKNFYISFNGVHTIEHVEQDGEKYNMLKLCAPRTREDGFTICPEIDPLSTEYQKVDEFLNENKDDLDRIHVYMCQKEDIMGGLYQPRKKGEDVSYLTDIADYLGYQPVEPIKFEYDEDGNLTRSSKHI